MRFAWPLALAESRGGKRKGRGITRTAQMNEENAEVWGDPLRAPGASSPLATNNQGVKNNRGHEGRSSLVINEFDSRSMPTSRAGKYRLSTCFA